MWPLAEDDSSGKITTTHAGGRRYGWPPAVFLSGVIGEKSNQPATSTVKDLSRFPVPVALPKFLFERGFVALHAPQICSTLLCMENEFYRKKKKRADIRGFLRRLVKNKRLLLAFIVGAPVVLYILFGNRGVVQRVRLQRQKAELEVKIREAGAETRSLQAEVKALDGDKKAIEKVAREKYGMVRDGETMYKVNKSK